MCYRLFWQIFSGGGINASSSVIYAQMFISLFFPLKFLSDSLKNKSLSVKIALLVLPGALLFIYAIMYGIGFSDFFSDSWNKSDLSALVSVTLTEQGVFEIVAFSSVFIVLTVIYSFVNKMKILPWLMTFGIESAAALSLLILYGGLFFRDFPFTIFDLRDKNIYLIRYPIYGLFTVILKDFLLVFSLVLEWIFHERKTNKEFSEQMLYYGREYYEKQAMKYLTKDSRPIGISCILFTIAAEGFMVYVFMSDRLPGVDGIIILIVMMLFFSFPAIAGFVIIVRYGLPKNAIGYRQLCAMGDEDVFRLFYDEIIKGKPEVRHFHINESELTSPTFRVRRSGARLMVERRFHYDTRRHLADLEE